MSTNRIFLDRFIFLILFGVLVVGFVFKVFYDKHLALDGVHYFRIILEHSDFVDIAWSRRFAEYLTEWPLVLGLHIGVHDLHILKILFGFGLFVPYVVCFLVCFFSISKNESSLLLIPLVGFLAVNLLSDYDLVAEHHTMTLITVPIAVLMAKEGRLETWAKVALIVLLLAYTRMYETAMLGGALFFVIAAYRSVSSLNVREKRYYLFICFLALAVVIIGIYYVWNPRAPTNRSSFLDALMVNKRNYEALSIYAFLFCIFAGLMFGRINHWFEKFWLVSAIMPIIFYGLIRITTDYQTTAYYSFSTRSLTVVTIPCLVLSTVALAKIRPVCNKSILTMFTVGFLFFNMTNLMDLKRWQEVRNGFVSILKSNSGFINIDDTHLRNNHHRWSWNNTLLSIVWSYPCVETIILNSTEHSIGPVDVRKELALTKYLEYGNEYLSIDSRARACEQ